MPKRTLTQAQDDEAFEAVCAAFIVAFQWRLTFNALIYFSAALLFGVGLAGAIVFAVVVYLATAAHFGRRTLVKLGMVLAALIVAVWVGLLPYPSEWHGIAAATIHELKSL